MKSTAHRRFLIWSRAGVWGRLHEEILHRLDDARPARPVPGSRRLRPRPGEVMGRGTWSFGAVLGYLRAL
ncbi:hypothetical protein ACIRD2_33950 [Streptomyces sp. NPDC093595]|uniref:hypothetical protein n=1 Tax=Streptomyces sp. NPDC093595 TaxID=3366045 RepID=UPI00382F6F6F